MKEQDTLPELHELAEQIGEFIHYWGFKRVHGRIWTHLFLAKKPLDAADLVRQMSISKALVSISLRELLDYEVIQEVGKSPRGTNLYRTNPDILSVILSVLRQREKRMLSRVQAAHESLGRVSDEDRERTGMNPKHLDQLGALISKGIVGLEGFIALKAVDFGDWRKDLVTVDLDEEAELRKSSIVAPPQPNRAQKHVHEEDAPASKASQPVNAELTMNSPSASQGDSFILPGGFGTRR